MRQVAETQIQNAANGGYKVKNKERIHDRPKSKIQNPTEELGFGILDRKILINFGGWIWGGCATKQFSDGGSVVRGAIPPYPT